MLRFILTALLLGPSLTASAATATTPFVDAWTFFGRTGSSSGMTLGEYDTAIKALGHQFDLVCGDTFCAGDYPNIQSLGVDCSVNAFTQDIGECVWSLAGSFARIDGATGKLTISQQVFTCNLGFQGKAQDLASFLRAAAAGGTSGADGLRDVTVPGAGTSLVDVLQGCL